MFIDDAALTKRIVEKFKKHINHLISAVHVALQGLQDAVNEFSILAAHDAGSQLIVRAELW